MEHRRAEILCSGMVRSGTHAVQEWIRDHFSGPVYVLNNVKTTESYFSGGLRDRGKQNYRYKRGEGGWIRVKDAPDSLPSVQTMVAFERATIGEAEMMFRASGLVGKHELHYRFIIIRDIYNMMASRLKKRETAIKSAAAQVSRQQTEIWKGYAERVSTGSWRRNVPRGIICQPINFNDWHRSLEYRRLLERVLGWDITDDTINLIPQFSGGSSFDGRRVPGQQMEVNERWRKVKLPSYILEDTELAELNKRLFGWFLDKDGNLCK